jgi:hypothetical protein
MKTKSRDIPKAFSCAVCANSQQPTANSQQPTANSQQPTNKKIIFALTFVKYFIRKNLIFFDKNVKNTKKYVFDVCGCAYLFIRDILSGCRCHVSVVKYASDICRYRVSKLKRASDTCRYLVSKLKHGFADCFYPISKLKHGFADCFCLADLRNYLKYLFFSHNYERI